jgi:cytochrome c oxidase subunit 2
VNPIKAKLLWSTLFLAIAVACVVSCVIAPGKGWWLPTDYSTYGHETDWLFNMILAITGVTFVIVQVILVYAMWRYGEDGTPRKGAYVHGHHSLEVAWTTVPALILVFIAIVQWSTWLKIKYPEHFPSAVRKDLKAKTPFKDVLAGQIEWRITYPGFDEKGVQQPLGTRYDVHVLNHIHIPRGQPILLTLRSRDVLHSLFLPNFRLKQDAVPGMSIPVWFEARPDADAGTFDLMCAELCGWGHYKMKGHITVHPDRKSFDDWLKKAREAEEAAQ